MIDALPEDQRSVPTSGSSPPVTPAPEELVPSSGFIGYLHT